MFKGSGAEIEAGVGVLVIFSTRIFQWSRGALISVVTEDSAESDINKFWFR